MGVSSCIRGYFIARRKVTPNAVCQIVEQIVNLYDQIYFNVTKLFLKEKVIDSIS